MRSDMKKVVVTRPRYDRFASDRKYHLSDTLEDSPSKESCRKPYKDRKEFSDHIKPLYRFLLGTVGRPWNNVYSEICEHIKLDSTMQRHVLQHVDQYVEKDVQIIDGKPYERAARNRWRGLKGYGIDGYYPIESSKSYTQLYVNPNTGLVCKAPMRVEKERKPVVTLVTLPDNKNIQFRLKTIVKNKGKQTITKWVALELAERPEPVTETDVIRMGGEWVEGRWKDGPTIRKEVTFTPGRDVFFDQPLRVFSESESKKYYSHSELYCVKVRDVNTEELETINSALAA